MSKSETTACTCCGMLVAIREYHPYAACLMFKVTRNSHEVRANLQAVVDHGRRIALKETVNA